MTVSLVGRMAMGRSNSLCPDFVTQATCTHTCNLSHQLNAIGHAWSKIKQS